MQNWLALT
jgi:hypothetical protein